MRKEGGNKDVPVYMLNIADLLILPIYGSPPVPNNLFIKNRKKKKYSMPGVGDTV